MTEQAAKPKRFRSLAFLLLGVIGCVIVLAAVVGLKTSVEFAALGFRDVTRTVYSTLGRPLPGTPDLSRFQERLSEKGLKLGAPLFIRIFKQEYELELWMQKGDRFVLFATYPICRYSGGLGPKLREGDRQSPEGFYTVSRSQLNPNSRWRRSFNLGYPNAYDASLGRTGGLLMVHGGCSSIGCYAMTNAVIDEIWTLVNSALDNGQSQLAVHVFPFRMSDWRMSLYENETWAPFWADLKRGYDLFERTAVPPIISVCNKRYWAIPSGSKSTGDEGVRVSCPREQAVDRVL